MGNRDDVMLVLVPTTLEEMLYPSEFHYCKMQLNQLY